MAEYINTIGQLTPAEMPKAPSNFTMETITGETTTTFNFTWTSNMTNEQFPETAAGRYYQVFQKWEAGATEWSMEDLFYDLSTNSYSLEVDKMNRATRYRAAVVFYDNLKNAFTELYASKPVIGYANTIQPQQITDLAVADVSYGGAVHGWIYDNTESTTGAFHPWFQYTNPNVDAGFYGYMRYYIFEDEIKALVAEDTQQQELYECKGFKDNQGNVTKYFGFICNTDGSPTTRTMCVDSVNEIWVATGQTAVITSPSGSDIPRFSAATDLQASNITQTSMRISWTNNSGDEAGDKYAMRLFKDGAQLSPALWNPVNYKDVTGLSPDTTYTFKVRTMKCNMHKFSDEYQFTTLA
jgi:hypothetical protein